MNKLVCMKRFLLFIACFSLLTSRVDAQAFTVISDTVSVVLNNASSTPGYNNITNPASTGSIKVRWTVASSNFPSDWITLIAACDNNTCYYNLSKNLWGGLGTPQVNTTLPINAGTTALFDLPMNLTTATTSGTYYIEFSLTDSASGYNKHVWYKVTRWATGVSNVNKTEDDISLYPNPASSQVNIVFNADADVKTVTIYNLIGKMESIYKVVGNSAGINIENLPKGIYFVRLMNSQNSVVAIRKFTK